MPCRCSPSSGRREPPISTFLPPIEDVALAIQSVGFPHSSSATHNPTPPSSAPQAPMGDTPMHSLHFGRRPTAYINFEWPPAHGAEGSANSQTASGLRDSLSVDCVNRHPSALFTPSRQRSFGCLTSVSRNIVITAHRHIQPLDLIGVSASRESGAVVCVEIRERNFHAHGSDFTAHRWGWLCIFRGGERGGSAKMTFSAVGGVQSPYGGKPP